MNRRAFIAAHVPEWALLDIAAHPEDFTVRIVAGTVKVTDAYEAVYYYRRQCIEQRSAEEAPPWWRWCTTHRVLPINASTLHEVKCQIDKRYPSKKKAA